MNYLGLQKRLLPTEQVGDLLTNKISLASKPVVYSENPIAQPSAYESIASFTVSTGVASYTFSSIPTTFKHLQIRCSVKDVADPGENQHLRIQVNGDTGANYYYHYILTNNGNTTSYDVTNATGSNYMYVFRASIGSGSNYTNSWATTIMDFLDYRSNYYKNMKYWKGYCSSNAGFGSGHANFGTGGGLWADASVISSITINGDGANFVSGSTFDLYGIK